MARPQSITDDEVLAAARAVFLDRGATATVEEVAARCGVGEATVFRRFPTKQALFIAAMDTDHEIDWARVIEPEAMAGRELREVLIELGRATVHSGRKIFPLILMKMSNPALIERERTPPRVTKTLEILTGFFAQEIAAGRIRARDPRVAARIWMGALQHLITFDAFMKPADNLPADTLIEGLVDFFCGLPEPAKPLKKIRKK